jgi:hypothetical protein
MKTSEILDGAAGVIQRQGWVQKNYYRSQLDAAGRERNPRSCAVCPRAAIALAVGRHPKFEVQWPAHREPRDADDPAELAEQDLAECADREAIGRAEEALVLHLLVVVGYRPTISSSPVIENWADQPSRTLPEVLQVMRECARLEREAGR